MQMPTGGETEFEIPFSALCGRMLVQKYQRCWFYRKFGEAQLTKPKIPPMAADLITR